MLWMWELCAILLLRRGPIAAVASSRMRASCSWWLAWWSLLVLLKCGQRGSKAFVARHRKRRVGRHDHHLIAVKEIGDYVQVTQKMVIRELAQIALCETGYGTRKLENVWAKREHRGARAPLSNLDLPLIIVLCFSSGCLFFLLVFICT